jgi:hypothetical protein
MIRLRYLRCSDHKLLSILVERNQNAESNLSLLRHQVFKFNKGLFSWKCIIRAQKKAQSEYGDQSAIFFLFRSKLGAVNQ